MDRESFGIEEAARRLNLTTGGVRFHCRYGRLGKKISGVWTFTEEDLEQFMEKRRGRGRPRQQEEEEEGE